MLEERFGALPAPDHDDYRDLLDEKSFRLYKQIESTDTTVPRYLAEQHQMRAYAVAFTILAVVALASIPVDPSPPCQVHLGMAGVYSLLAVLSIWRMEDKRRTLGRHVLTRFLEPE
jgi:hypothetical protein